MYYKIVFLKISIIFHIISMILRINNKTLKTLKIRQIKIYWKINLKINCNSINLMKLFKDKKYNLIYYHKNKISKNNFKNNKKQILLIFKKK